MLESLIDKTYNSEFKTKLLGKKKIQLVISKNSIYGTAAELGVDFRFFDFMIENKNLVKVFRETQKGVECLVRQPTPLPETPGHSRAHLGLSLVASCSFLLAHTRFCLCPPRVFFSSPV